MYGVHNKVKGVRGVVGRVRGVRGGVTRTRRRLNRGEVRKATNNKVIAIVMSKRGRMLRMGVGRRIISPRSVSVLRSLILTTAGSTLGGTSSLAGSAVNRFAGKVGLPKVFWWGILGRYFLTYFVCGEIVRREASELDTDRRELVKVFVDPSYSQHFSFSCEEGCAYAVLGRCRD